MTQAVLDRLQSIDLDVLTEVVRQDQRRPALVIRSWAVQPLSNKGIINPGGLWSLAGHARDGQETCAWSLVVKVLRRPQAELSPSELWYWKREVDFAQSPLRAQLPGPIRAPRFYRVDEYLEDVWLWMEHVRPSSTAPWILDDFRLTAHDLGRWNGACLAQCGLLEAPWLARYHYRTVMDDSSTEDWEFALNQQYLSPSVRARHAQLVAERELFSRAIDALPHTIGHLDAQCRNLLLCDAAAGHREVVLIDWPIAASHRLAQS